MQEILRGNQPEKENKNQDEAEIIDLISPVDCPEKIMTEILFIGRTGGKIETKRKENEDQTTNEEHEKQTEDDNNNKEEDKKITHQTRNEK